MSEHTLLIAFLIVGAVWLIGGGGYYYAPRTGYTRPAHAPYSIVGVVLVLVVVYLLLTGFFAR